LRQFAYVPIVGAGKNGAVLHYNTNTARIAEHDMILIDAGSEYMGYGTDITRTFPANGKFTANQASVYNIVLESQESAISKLEPGARWHNISVDVHYDILGGLQKAGFLVDNASLEELYKANISHIFLPHGLGHFVGMWRV